MKLRILILFGFVLLLFKGVFAATVEIGVSTATGDGTGTLPDDIQTDNNVFYQPTKNEYLQVQSFDTTGRTETINSVTLNVRYYVDTDYAGTNYIQYSTTDGAPWTDTTIQPSGSDTSEVEKTYTLPSSIDTWSEIDSLDIYFYNNQPLAVKIVYFDRVWLVVDYTVCGDATCEGTETYSNCRQDCCEADCTSTTDTTCHLECDTYNGCAFSDSTARTACDGQTTGTTVCYNGEATVSCCEASYSTCSGCFDCASGVCNVDDNTECDGTESSCGCSSGTCQTCASGNYCTSYTCTACSTTCDNACQDSACYGTDPDCDAGGGLGGVCCGDSTCDSGEACSTDCSTEIYCGDGVDNDQDGITDWLDSDCGGTETNCADSTDNDADGLTDCADVVDCPANTACATGICCSETCSTPLCTATNLTACDDSNACTTDTCSSPNTCSASCVNTVITACTNDDGCCPAGCDNNNDNDCSVTCNNGVCEAGEDYSNCPGDCCDADGTAHNDTICHSSCSGVSSECNSLDISLNICASSNEGYCDSGCDYTVCIGCYDCQSGACTLVDHTECLAPEYCLSGTCTSCPSDACGAVDSGVVNDGTDCDDAEGITSYSVLSHCTASCTACTGCYDCSSATCSTDDNTECDGTESSCGCSSGTCQSCSSSYFCSSYACLNCNTTCDNTCQDSACYGTDPDCISTGGLVSEDTADNTYCCGNTICEGGGGESCLNCESDCGDCPVNCGDGTCDADENKCTCPSDCGYCTGTYATCKEYKCVSARCSVVDKTNCCGNGVCEASEDASSCSTDCGSGCDDSNACTLDSYDYGAQKCVYTPITPCCGNGECESGETYLSCPADCAVGGAEVGNITILITKPTANQVFGKGTTIDIKVDIKIGDIVGKNVTVTASGFFGETTLYDDGLHNDNLANDGTYANTVDIAKDISTGKQVIQISAVKDTKSETKSITVEISGILSATLQTDKETYEKGEKFIITGTAKDANDNPVKSGKANLKFTYSNWVQTAEADITNGEFKYEYIISFGNPDGLWNITISAEDEYKNIGEASAEITVSIPSAVALQYNVQVLSPVEGIKYKRGETIPVSIKITELGEKVEKANVSFIAPDGQKIMLTETSPGVYSGKYVPKWDDPMGDWSVSVEGFKEVEGELKAGGTYVPVKIEPANLNIELQELPEKIYFDESITLTASVSYPDGTLVSGADIIILGPENQTLKLKEIDIGVYQTTYTPTEEDIGVLSFKIEGSDANLNTGKSKQASITIAKRTPFEELINKIIKFLQEIWWIFVIAILIAAIVMRKYTAKAGLRKKKESLEKELRTIRELKIDAEKKYFKEGKITRETYDDLIKKYNEKEAEVKSKILDLAKMEKKKPKKGKKEVKKARAIKAKKEELRKAKELVAGVRELEGRGEK